MGSADSLRTRLIYHPLCLEHDTGRHVERRERLEATLAAIHRRYGAVPLEEPEPASLAAIETVHAPDYVRAVADIARRGGGLWDYDTVIGPRSFEAALCAAGAACAAVDAVVSDRADAGVFALGRPPGHHACPDIAMGFCLFNNVAVAARHAQRAHGVERVLIVDWDVHHGNGTQEIFYQDGTVAYFSTHQWPLYPGTGKWTESGAGAGLGCICNVPLPAGVGDSAYHAAFSEVLAPFARRFRPDLILVSAGYDAHYRDPLAQMAVTTGGFAMLTGLVADLADELCAGRLAFVLEGGYDLDALSSGLVATLERLNSRAGADPPLLELSPVTQTAIERAARHHHLTP